MLPAINICTCYIRAKSCSEKALNLLLNLQNEVYALNARKVKQTKLFNFFKVGTKFKIMFYFLISLLFVKFYTCGPTVLLIQQKNDALSKFGF